jgi:hypothetical protein
MITDHGFAKTYVSFAERIGPSAGTPAYPVAALENVSTFHIVQNGDGHHHIDRGHRRGVDMKFHTSIPAFRIVWTDVGDPNISLAKVRPSC